MYLKILCSTDNSGQPEIFKCQKRIPVDSDFTCTYYQIRTEDELEILSSGTGYLFFDIDTKHMKEQLGKDASYEICRVDTAIKGDCKIFYTDKPVYLVSEEGKSRGQTLERLN